MRTNHWKKLFSYLMILAGLGLLFLGARDLLDWHLGQQAAAHDFERPIPDAPPSVAGKTSHPKQPNAPEVGDTLAKLIIPRLDAELYVVEGDGPHELRRGPGHLEGTALPGSAGNCVIAGHRDTHFRVLKDIQRGDDIVVQTKAGKFLYRVESLKIVEPENTSALQPTSDAELNLITCYPFYYVGSAPKRLVVEARLAGSIARAS